MSRQYAALRGIAIFLVVLNHSITLSLGYATEHNYGHPSTVEHVILVSLQTLGLIAVPTFYFISGGFQVYAMRGKPVRAAYRVIARALPHIIIPYLVWSILFYLLLFVIRGDLYTIPEYLKFILVGYPLNFVPLLLFYYLLSPLLVRLIFRWPGIAMLAIALYQAASLIILRPALIGIDIPTWSIWLTIPGLRLSIALWGTFFPLGIAVGLYSERIIPFIKRSAILWVALSVLAYIGVVIHELAFVRIPFASIVLPFFVVLTFPIISRESIPLVFQLEQLGRRAYGLYLSNLIWISIGLLITDLVSPGLFTRLLMLFPLLMMFTIAALWIVMRASEKLPTSFVRRYVFG